MMPACSCETPKSPPGDYNFLQRCLISSLETTRVKHLNPRQGITTDMQAYFLGYLSQMGVKHLNPRQGITTQRLSLTIPPDFCSSRVKHLNPRQGITTYPLV